MLRVFPDIFRGLPVLCSWDTETTKILPKARPYINAKFPGKFAEKNSQKLSGEQAWRMVTEQQSHPLAV